MKVSVLIGAYNHEHFIARAINSVLMQVGDLVGEIIIYEDASPDRTREVVRGFQEQYPHTVHLLLRETAVAERDRAAGIGGKTSLVEGLQSCRGEYIALLDGDDFWTDPLKLQKQIQFLDDHPEFAICFHNSIVVREDGTQDADYFCRSDQKEMSSLEDLLGGNFIHSGSAVFRRGLFGKLPDWFYTTKSGDWALHSLNAHHGKIGYLNEAMAAYRIHQGGFWSAEKSTIQLLDGIELLTNLNAYTNHKYDRVIKTAQGKYYGELSDLHEREGDLSGAKMFLAQRLKLDLSSSRLPHKYLLWKFMKLQLRAFSSRLGLLSNSAKPGRQR